MTTGIVCVGRWRLELSVELWRVRRRPRVVLWGARAGDVAFGARADRAAELERELLRRMFETLTRDRVKVMWGDISISSFEGIPRDAAVVVEAGSAMPAYAWISDVGEDVQPLAKLSRVRPDEEKLRAYSGARGWSPEDGDQA